MSNGSGSPPTGAPPGGSPPSTKRAAIGLQLKLPCATADEVRARYGEELQKSRFFVRTRTPRPKDTLVRLEALYANGTPCFRAAAVVVHANAGENAGDLGMSLSLLAIDDLGRALLEPLGGAVPPALKAEPARPAAAAAPPPPPAPHSHSPSPKTDLTRLKGITAPPAAGEPIRKSSPPAPPASTPAPPAAADKPLAPPAAPASPQPPPAAAGKPLAPPAAPAKAPPSAVAAGKAPVPPSAPAPSAPPRRPDAPITTPPSSFRVAPPKAPPTTPPAPSGLAELPLFDEEPPTAAVSAVAGPAASAAPPPAAPPSTPAPPQPTAAASSAVPPTPATSPGTPASPEPAPALPPDRPAAKKKKGVAIGIDLGTTNSCAAVVRDGHPFVIPSREGYNTIPSIVAVNDKGKVIVGHPAKGQLLVNPRNTVFGAKRLVGRPFTSPIVAELVGRYPYDIVAGPEGEAAVRLGSQQLSLEQVSGLVLSEVKELAQQWLKTEVTRAVITVPAYYNDNQRQAVREAGRIAGLDVERILNEPTAAALAFAHGRKLQQRLLVYDLGGGTFDASLLELNDNVYEVVSTGGDTFLGGVDFDQVLVDHLLQSFRDRAGIDFPGDRVALQRVADAAERAKMALSEQLEVKIKVPFIALVGEKPYDLEATVSRTELVALTGHLVDRTLKVCSEVLAARNLTPQDVGEVLLVGGQSRMPLVRERIRNFFGREPSKAVHPDEAVALGAAVLAHELDSPDIAGAVLVDVLPMSIGVGLPGGRFRRIVERNASLPQRKVVSLSTTRDDQTSLEVVIFQGETDRAQENEYLGTLSVPGLPKGPKGSVHVDIVFAVSAEATLTVTAEEAGTGRTTSATFTTRDTPDVVRRRLAEESEAGAPGQAAAPEPAGGLFGKLRRMFGGAPRP